jgi:hypothetical protein
MCLFKNSLFSTIVFIAFSCNEPAAKKEAEIIKEHPEAAILSLEKKWLDAEFNLDTSTIAGLLHPRFISVNGRQISGKQEELAGIYNNISAMQKEGILLDSLRLEDAQVRLFDSTAIATFIVHTFKKDKGKPVEKRTRFYDVWIKRSGQWKAVSSQGTIFAENQP